MIGDCKFFFVCGRNVSLFIPFFHLNKHFWLYCCKSVEWKQKQQWDKFRLGKKLERKAKSFNMADWVSVDFDMTLIEHTNWLRMRLKYYELHQTPNESQKAKCIFCRDLMTWDPTIMGKPKRCVYGLGFGRKRPNPRPSPNNNLRFSINTKYPSDEMKSKNESQRSKYTNIDS